MLIKLILVFSLILSSSFAYKKGDVLEANTISMLNLKKEKVYILDFFASWCLSCKIEIPLISKLNTKLDKNKYEIIGIDIDEEIKEAISFQRILKKKNQLNFNVINDSPNLIVKKFNPIGVPALYIIKNYRVKSAIFGAVNNIDEKIITELEKIK